MRLLTVSFVAALFAGAACRPTTTSQDAGTSIQDAGQPREAAVAPDAANAPDAASPPDAAMVPDASSPPDAAAAADAGSADGGAPDAAMACPVATLSPGFSASLL